ncbi:DNA alkylation repair protein [bacterium]|nr:MAG: DNA alkylation repair protein [bacterium]
MAALERVGTEKLRAAYVLHGATGNYFGVSTAQFKRLKKKIGSDQRLALELWKSNNIDAQILATMIVEQNAINESLMDDWITRIHYYAVADEFVGNVVALSSFAKLKMLQWINSNEEYVRRCGYTVMSYIAHEKESLSDDEFIQHLHAIGKEIQLMENRARQAMYEALIAIGQRNKLLNMEAMIVASQIGPVYIEHGDKKLKASHAMEILADKKLRESLS